MSADHLPPPTSKPRVFLSAPGMRNWPIPGARSEPDRYRWLVRTVAEETGIPPRQLRTGIQTWHMRTAPLHGRPYEKTLDEAMRLHAGIVLLLPGNGFPVSASILGELAAAERAGLPGLVVTADGEVSPLATCTVEPLTIDECRPPDRIARFVTPDGGGRLSEVRAVLAVMGINQVAGDGR